MLICATQPAWLEQNTFVRLPWVSGLEFQQELANAGSGPTKSQPRLIMPRDAKNVVRIAGRISQNGCEPSVRARQDVGSVILYQRIIAPLLTTPHNSDHGHPDEARASRHP